MLANWLAEVEPKHEIVFREFVKVAHQFYVKNDRQAVLVLDNLNYMANSSPNLLWEYQQKAKDAADYSKFHMVFVCSDGRAPIQMHSEWNPY
jgi:hypothetical protein